MCLSRLIGSFVAVLFLALVDRVPANEVDETLSKVFQYWNSHTPATYRFHFQYTQPGNEPAHPTSESPSAEWSVDLQQNRFHLLIDLPSQNANPSKIQRQFIEAVQTDDRFYRLMGSGEIANAVHSVGNQSSGEINKAVKVDVGLLVGLLPIAGDSRMRTLLNQMDVKLEHQGELIVLSGSGKEDRSSLQLTLDPAHEFAARVIHWKGDAVEVGETAEFTFEVIEFGVLGAPNTPAKFRTVHKIRGGEKVFAALGGEVVKIEPQAFQQILNIDSIQKQRAFTDDDFQPVKQIPNGTRVNVDDAGQRKHVWRDGQVVVVEDLGR